MKHLPRSLTALLCVFWGYLQAAAPPLVDLSGDTARQVIVAQGTEQVYHGHPTTLLLPDGKTMFCVWTRGHGGTAGPLKRSDDGGRTWSEELPVPATWWRVKNCPAIYRLSDPQGLARLIVYAGQGPDGTMQQSVSLDEGKTWSPMQSNGLVCVMPFCTIVPVEGGKKLIGLSNIRRPDETQDKLSNVVTQSESTDGGLTWSPWRVLVDLGNLKPCEPEVIRSPDGKKMLCLMRENIRSESGHFITSEDEGKTWSEVRALPPGLHGDRHKAVYARDGRLVIAFRDMGKDSPTRTHFVAWVGRYEDILSGKDGDYKIKLLHSHKGSDCGYPGLELLPDGTLVTTTYIKYRPGPEKNSVVSTRFTLEETDRAQKHAAPGPAEVKALGILLDDTRATLTGGWTESRRVHALVGESYAVAASTTRCTATFEVDIPETGPYEVRVLYTAAANRCTKTLLTVRTVEGEKTVPLNQRLDCLDNGIPRSAGVFGLPKGKITLALSNPDADGFVSLDGVQIVPEEAAKAERATQSGAGFPTTTGAATGPVKIPPPMLLKTATEPADVRGKSYDLVVIGGTPGGIACAVRAAREGLSVLLVNHTMHLGGFITSGAGGWEAPWDGFRSPLYAEMLSGAQQHYAAEYGEGSQNHLVSMPSKTSRGHIDRPKVEPRIAEMLFNEMTSKEKTLTVLLGHVVAAAQRDKDVLKSITLKSRHGGDELSVSAKIFADAMVEGDLMAAAGVKTQIGRESKAQYGEKHAGVIYTKERHKEPGQRGFPQAADQGKLNIRYNPHSSGEILEGPNSGEADGSVMAYNYRLILTRDPGNRVILEKPANYDPAIAKAPALGGMSVVPNLPNNKIAWNGGRLVGPQNAYPSADWTVRETISRRYLDAMLMRLWWLHNDPQAPQKEREYFAGYGLAADEFPDNHHVPYEIYVREARRLVGRYVFKEHDNVVAEGLDRTPIHSDSIALTDWPMDSVACLPRAVPGGSADGILFLGEESRPAQVPYRCLLPNDVKNLLVSVAISASHVGWGSIRLEPVWMQLGESAGHAAALAVKGQTTPAELAPDKLIRKLAASRMAVTFFNDVDAAGDDPRVLAAQYFGTKGFFAGYDAKLGEPLSESLQKAWLEGFTQLQAGTLDPMRLARMVREAEAVSSSTTAQTRGDFLLHLWQKLPPSP